MSQVSIRDYQEPQHLILNALLSVGLQMDYITADLIHTTLEKYGELGSKFSLKDAAKIQVAHEEKWTKYFKDKEDAKSES